MPAMAGSMAATSSKPGSSSTARHTAWPIRPPAPSTPTRTTAVTLSVQPRRDPVEESVEVAGVEGPHDRQRARLAGQLGGQRAHVVAAHGLQPAQQFVYLEDMAVQQQAG